MRTYNNNNNNNNNNYFDNCNNFLHQKVIRVVIVITHTRLVIF